MNKYAHLIIIGEWEGFHRRRFMEILTKRFHDWSDFIFIQTPISLTVNLFYRFKDKFIGYITGKYEYTELESGIKLFTPIIIFNLLLWSKIKFLKNLDVFLYSFQINRFIKKRLFDKKIIFWVIYPEHYMYARKIKYDYLVYDLYENYIYTFKSKLIKDKAYYNQELMKICDLIISSGVVMYEQAKNLNKNSLYLPSANNAGDVDFKYDENIKTELSDIKEPIIGYVGNIRFWIDFSLIELLLKEFPYAKIVFVGPVDRTAKKSVRKLLKYKNFMLTGNKPLEMVPYYLKEFDVGIVPFKYTKFTEGTSPYKFYEYLIAGIPIVTTNLPDQKVFKDVVGYAETNEEFVQYCKDAINGGFKEKVKKYKEIAKENTYEKRVDVLVKTYKDVLNLPQ